MAVPEEEAAPAAVMWNSGLEGQGVPMGGMEPREGILMLPMPGPGGPARVRLPGPLGNPPGLYTPEAAVDPVLAGVLLIMAQEGPKEQAVPGEAEQEGLFARQGLLAAPIPGEAAGLPGMGPEGMGDLTGIQPGQVVQEDPGLY